MSCSSVARRSWTAPGHRWGGPLQWAAGVGQDLGVDSVALMFARVVRRVFGDVVDRDEGAVRVHVHELGGLVRGGFEGAAWAASRLIASRG
jgi:hypothetical protein